MSASEHLEDDRAGSAAAPDATALPDSRTLDQRIQSVLRTIYDPEIPVDIYELGLVYEVSTVPQGRVTILMTLTSPHCPVAESLPVEVKRRVLDVSGVREVEVKITWDPPWSPERMSEAAKLQLGMV